MPPRRWQRPRARSRRRRDGGRVEVAACRLTAWKARGPSAGSRGRRAGGLGLLATARVGGGPLTRPGCRRAHRPGPNRRRAGRPVDGGVHRSVHPPGIHGRPSGATRREIRTPWTVDIESSEPLQPPRSPGGRFHRRLPTANRCAIRRAGGSQGRGCWSLHSAGFGSIGTGGGAGGRCRGRCSTARWRPIWPAGGAAGRGRRTVRRRRAAGIVGGPVRWGKGTRSSRCGGPVRWGGGTRSGGWGGPVRRGRGTWSGRCSRWRRLGGAALAADRRSGAEPVAGGRGWWTRRFRVAWGGRRGPIAHGTAGGGRPRRRLGLRFAGGRRRLLGSRLLAPHRHRLWRSAGLLRSWTVRSPPTRPNGRTRLRTALDHRARLDLGVWTRIHPRPLTRLIPARRTRMVPGLRTWMVPDLRTSAPSGIWTLLTLAPRTRPTFCFWAPVGLLPGTWVGLPLRARVVLGVRVGRGTGRPDRLVRWGSISVALPRPIRPALIGRDRGPDRRGGRFWRPLARIRRRSARPRNGPLRPGRRRR
jgi:hypothetical protein